MGIGSFYKRHNTGIAQNLRIVQWLYLLQLFLRVEIDAVSVISHVLQRNTYMNIEILACVMKDIERLQFSLGKENDTMPVTLLCLLTALDFLGSKVGDL